MKKLKNGKWQVRYRDDEKRQRARNFRNKLQAEDFCRRLDRGEFKKRVGEDLTFAEFAARWLTQHAMIEKAETTVKEDEGVIRLHLNPALGALRLSELRKANLLDLRAKLKTKAVRCGKTMSPKTVNNILGLAKGMLTTAVEWEYLLANPFLGVKSLPKAKQAFDFWTAEERDRFLVFCRHEDPAFAQLVLVAAHTGLRKGELCALRRHQLDFGQGLIRVDAGYSEKLKKRFGRTKNYEVEFVRMNALVQTTLRDRTHMLAEAPVFDRQLFVDCYDRFRRRTRQLGMREIRFHDLRHTFASTLVMAGVPLYTAQKMMRHKSIAMTERYAHLAPAYMREAAEMTCAPFEDSQRTTAPSN